MTRIGCNVIITGIITLALGLTACGSSTTPEVAAPTQHRSLRRRKPITPRRAKMKLTREQAEDLITAIRSVLDATKEDEQAGDTA